MSDRPPMTATNDPADVIEQAAKVMSLRHHGRESSACNMRSHEKDARALHAAGLLADPADRDERRNEAYRAQLARADRAEAEVAVLRATVDRVRALADRWNTEWLESVRPEHRSKVRPAWAARGIWRALDGAGESE